MCPKKSPKYWGFPYLLLSKTGKKIKILTEFLEEKILNVPSYFLGPKAGSSSGILLVFLFTVYILPTCTSSCSNPPENLGFECRFFKTSELYPLGRLDDLTFMR